MAKESLHSSDSGFDSISATMYVTQKINKDRASISLVSLETSVASLLQGS